jgi:ESF2/ABP1 family protein
VAAVASGTKRQRPVDSGAGAEAQAEAGSGKKRRLGEARPVEARPTALDADGGDDDTDASEDAEGGGDGNFDLGLDAEGNATGAAELQPERLASFEAKERHKGIVYVARVPPYMQPIKVRHLLQPYGTVTRLYLAPEDPIAYKKRVKKGGNKKTSFTEGWVEFADKADAKAVARLLNLQPIGNNKSGFYASDLWNLRYLHGFRWHHLTEKIAYEAKIRAQKLRAELSQAKHEAEAYITEAEKTKKRRDREARKQGSSGETGGRGSGNGDREELSHIMRTFKQKKAIVKEDSIKLAL